MKKTNILVIFAIVIITLTATLSAEVSDGKTEWDDGILYWKSDDGKFSTRMDARIYINGAYFFDDTENILSNQTNLRKARFALKTKLWGVWHAEFDLDIAEEQPEVEDMFIAYTGFKNSHIKFGNFKMPLSLNELTSSRFLTFCERSYTANAFETDRHCGLEYSKWGKYGKFNLNLRSAVFGQDLEVEAEKDYEKEVDETGGGYATRLVSGIDLTNDLFLHTGISSAIQYPDDGKDMMDFKTEPETKIGDIEFLDTGDIYDVNYCTKIGLEGALQFNNICFQSEYILADVIRLKNLKDASFSGGYAFVSWILTGEKRNWSVKDGEFGQIIPKNLKTGAWEVAARYSYLDLSDEDADILGGIANNYTFALNWYANPNIKFQFDYTIVDNSKNANSDGDYDGDYDFNYIQFMAVVAF
ncbi:MAG: porin [Candidatus Cloacimonadota bacterium]|nr:porin [Candidatus Cloacimonadota bacterium]